MYKVEKIKAKLGAEILIDHCKGAFIPLSKTFLLSIDCYPGSGKTILSLVL